MKPLIETISGVVLIFLIQKIYNIILQIILTPFSIPYLDYLDKKAVSGSQHKKPFRFDFFVTNALGYFLTVFTVNFLLKLLPWNFHLNLVAIIIVVILFIIGIGEEGFLYEASVKGGIILGLVIGYFVFIF